MNSGWVKHFADDTKEYGWDHLVDARLASWSKGRLEKMAGVTIHQNGRHIDIFGDGEYWQSDTFEARFLVSEGIRVERTIYRKIRETDHFICFDGDGSSKVIVIEDHAVVPCEHLMAVKKEWVGKWFTLTIKENDNIIWEVRKFDGRVS